MSDEIVTEQTEQAAETPDAAVETAETSEQDAPLMKALQAERASNKELKSALAALQKEAEQTKLAALTDSERAVEEARRAGYEAALAEVKGEMTKSKVTAAAAAAGFADPADAIGFLGSVDLDGDEAISAAIGELAKAKPYLLKRSAAPLEQGVQSKQTKSPSDWLREALGA